MRRRLAGTIVLLAAVAVTGCGGASTSNSSPVVSPDPSTSSSAPTSNVHSPGSPGSPTSPAPATSQTPTPSTPSPTPRREQEPRWDKRNTFYESDKRLYESDWFAGRSRIMINFGCTPAPYYDPSPRCSGGQGFHHGMDVALPCGTELRSAVRGTVTNPARAGTPGPSYGSKAFRINDSKRDVDILIAHASKVFVSPGDKVAPGDRIALAGAEGAPDGCHLHLEVRPARGGVSSAIDPSPILDLEVAS